MGLEDHSFSFFPFGALYCLTLFCFVAVVLINIRYRFRDYSQKGLDITTILKSRLAEGEIDKAEYQRLLELLTK
ncbi:hypothetical protein M1K46_23790 [Fictibacillus sp. WQ 8-8]|uniref:hypothetical protein n=1 Tax=Fictibacillus sp. WQ 8-8 TaxID=2938788 RepID=UPI00210DE38F|nr:hypothetical protein [Fictibacillus sp. WQ 8-8]MCQ6268603.1 hypothetical protein [Fictibacillus sp. WQ 8-8]